MNIYDLAHQLARAVTETPEFVAFKKAKDELEKDPQARNMLRDLRTRQLEVEALRLSGKPVDEESKSLENLYNIASHNSLLRNYMEAEQRFLVMMSDIQQIIFKTSGLNMDFNESLERNE